MCCKYGGFENPHVTSHPLQDEVQDGYGGNDAAQRLRRDKLVSSNRAGGWGGSISSVERNEDDGHGSPRAGAVVFERRAVALRQADRAAPVGHVRREERGLGARVELEGLARQNDLRGDPVISRWLRRLDGVEGDWTQRQTAWRASVLSGSEKSRRSYARSRSTRTVAAPDVAAHATRAA